VRHPTQAASWGRMIRRPNGWLRLELKNQNKAGLQWPDMIGMSNRGHSSHRKTQVITHQAGGDSAHSRQQRRAAKSR
jgi:hypothetical protein